MKIKTDFPGGNGKDFEISGKDHIRFVPDPRNGKYALWFHFLVEEVVCKELMCEIKNGRNILGWPFKSIVKPVFSHGNNLWKRVSFSLYDTEKDSFFFTVPVGITTEIAFCFPYQVDHWQEFYAKCIARHKGDCVEIGRSTKGRPLFVYQFGNSEDYIWLTARCHAGEVSGSYVLEGIILEYLASKNLSFSLKVLPFLDIDGVVEGMYGKERFPVDFNRCWGSQTMQPEIEACKDYLHSFRKGPIVAVDCHSPAPNEPHYLDCTISALMGKNFSSQFNRLIKTITEECQKKPETTLDPGLSKSHMDWYLPEGFEQSQPGYLQFEFSTMSFTVEAAYHATCQKITACPDNWRRLGKAILRGINSFLKTNYTLI